MPRTPQLDRARVPARGDRSENMPIMMSIEPLTLVHHADRRVGHRRGVRLAGHPGPPRPVSRRARKKIGAVHGERLRSLPGLGRQAARGISGAERRRSQDQQRNVPLRLAETPHARSAHPEAAGRHRRAGKKGDRGTCSRRWRRRWSRSTARSKTPSAAASRLGAQLMQRIVSLDTAGQGLARRDAPRLTPTPSSAPGVPRPAWGELQLKRVVELAGMIVLSTATFMEQAHDSGKTDDARITVPT